ncbi:MAG: hypothetical protein HY901_18005 [Deltaproteobacteria bacterium]|nr:hypothetical protein [Deltaproteobacteria bacterium]
MPEKNPVQNATAQVTETWAKMMTEQSQRITAIVDEMAKLESRGMEQFRVAIEESTRLTKSALEYQAQLAGEWRKMAVEAARRSVEMITPKA